MNMQRKKEENEVQEQKCPYFIMILIPHSILSFQAEPSLSAHTDAR